jgi:hypothetical protein
MLRWGCGGGDAVSNDGGGDGGALARGDILTGGNNSFDGLSLMVSLDVIIRWCYLVHFFGHTWLLDVQLSFSFGYETIIA